MEKKAKVIEGKKSHNTRHDRRKPKATNPSTRKAVTKAPAPMPADQLAVPSYKVVYRPIDEIKVDLEKRRPVIPSMVAILVKSIPKDGLRFPLIVRLLHGVAHLVAGLQRLEALKILQWEEVPCICIEDDENIARRVQLIENALRAELTRLEKANQTKELLESSEPLEQFSGETVRKKPGRPEGGDAKAARQLQVPGKTVEAKRKKIASDRKIGSLSKTVQEAATEAGFDGDAGKLAEIADEETEEEQLAKVEELKRRPKKTSAPADGETHFEMMVRKWRDQKKLVRADWEKAAREDKRQFIVEALQYPLKRKKHSKKKKHT
jgi:ParB-like chromosome segregation protein Spo0J